MLGVDEIRRLTTGELHLLELDGGIWIGPARTAASAPCRDCGIDTTPRDGEGNPHVSGWEWYVVRDEVWKQATSDERGILCIGCLEERLGRQLTPQDFADLPINKATAVDTARLGERKGLS